jgi:hypothetical protein
MPIIKSLTLASTLSLFSLAAAAELAHDHEDPAARGRSNEAISAEQEATVMPTNPNAGAGAIGTDGDPYQPRPDNSDHKDDDRDDRSDD